MTAGAPVLAGFGGVLLFLAAGRGLVEVLPALRERPLAARLGWSYLLGVAAVPGVVYLLGIAFGAPVRRATVLAPVVVFAVLGLLARRLRGRAPGPEVPRPPAAGRRAARAAFGISAVVAAGLFAEAVAHRETGWDSEMTWTAAARWVRADHTVTPRALTDPRVFVDHPQYPLLLPVAQVVVQETFGAGDDPRVIKPLYAAFFPALLLVFFDLVRRHTGSAAAALAALALGIAPFLAFGRSGGAAGAYSDVPLGAFFGAGLLLLVGRARKSEGMAAGVLLGAAVLTKNEGLPLALVALVTGVAVVLLDRSAARGRRFRAVALAAGAVLLAALALHAWKANVPQRFDEDYLDQFRKVSLAKEAAARLPLLPAEIGAETASWNDWSGLWLAAGVAFVAGASGLRRRIVPPVLVALGASLALYVGAMLVSSWGGAVQVHATWNRLLLQLSLPLGLLLALALRAGLRAIPDARAWLEGAAMIPEMADRPAPRRAFSREALVFLAFLALTVAMTWPWAKHLRDHCSDVGDPYLNSWILWWDYHATFHAPLHLFDGNVFFPDKLSLAFSEHNYGLALPLFPLFALGLRPLTAQGILTLLGFAFSGYGAFRLGRTLTGSTGAAWVAGVAFAFVPYRFGHLPHVNYLFAGWIPILFEALVLFLRERSPRRAAWLGAAFFLNALSVIHWFVLTLVPLAAVALVLAVKTGVEKDRAGWKRAVFALGVAGIALLPFLLPYQRAAKLYGFTRGVDETREFSAQLHDWMNADPRNRLWAGFSEFPTPGERALFPGFLLLALPLAALLLFPTPREASETSTDGAPPDRRLLFVLDGVAVVTGFLALFAASPAGIHVRLADREVFRATEPWRALAVFAIALTARCWFAYPAALPLVRSRSLKESLRSVRRPDAIVVGLLLAVLGFFGSFGVRFPFHRLLFETVFLFRSIRGPVRWAMIAYLGLAILAGAGVLALAEAWRRRRPGARTSVLFAAACLAFLFEDRAAPLDLTRGEADPDEVTRFFAATRMKGGIVELPSGTVEHGNYRAMLRAADHGKPLVTAVSGFASPTVRRIEEDERKAPIPDDLLDFLEGIPTSYVLVHETWLDPALKTTHRAFLDRALSSGRLVFVKRFDGEEKNDLFAVAKNEPAARPLEPLPWSPPAGLTPSGSPWRENAELTGSIDVPAEGAAVKGTLEVAGWARVPGEDLDVSILVDGERRASASFVRTGRVEVCSVLPALGTCAAAGYAGTFAFQPGDEGAHEIVVLFRSKDGRERHYPPRRFVWRP